ncbi:hypothetical protein [Melissospora conviva]|uniref:hypothetical protein n=1 Tax=Melissospora conviva TaxID=3388432 RepID=UPI003B821C02
MTDENRQKYEDTAARSGDTAEELAESQAAYGGTMAPGLVNSAGEKVEDPAGSVTPEDALTSASPDPEDDTPAVS